MYRTAPTRDLKPDGSFIETNQAFVSLHSEARTGGGAYKWQREWRIWKEGSSSWRFPYPLIEISPSMRTEHDTSNV
jgi:hypothetical protein